jgi:rhodanese-related sulfurtransferase
VDTASLNLSSSFSIAPDELLARLAQPNPPLLLDVRRAAAYGVSPARLVGAVRCQPDAVPRFAAEQPPREVVVYCVYGHEVGCTAALALRAAGWDARFLAGGFEGGEPGVDAEGDIARWRAVPLPREAKQSGARE